MVTSPDVGATNPSKVRSVVVLPAPFGPRNPHTSPGSTVNVRSSTAFTAPNRLVRWRTSIARAVPAGTTGADASPVEGAVVAVTRRSCKFLHARDSAERPEGATTVGDQRPFHRARPR